MAERDADVTMRALREEVRQLKDKVAALEALHRTGVQGTVSGSAGTGTATIRQGHVVQITT